MGQGFVPLGLVVVLSAGVLVPLGKLDFEQFVDVVAEVEPAALLLLAISQYAKASNRACPGSRVSGSVPNDRDSKSLQSLAFFTFDHTLVSRY